MTVLSRLLIAALAAYILIGVAYATWEAVYYEFFAKILALWRRLGRAP